MSDSLLCSDVFYVDISPSSLKRGALLGGFALFISAISFLPLSYSNYTSISKKLYLSASPYSLFLNFSFSLMVSSR